LGLGFIALTGLSSGLDLARVSNRWRRGLFFSRSTFHRINRLLVYISLSINSCSERKSDLS
jgi:hypothetical protein